MADSAPTFPQHLLTALQELATVFDRFHVRHALIGGLAAGYRSRPRYTKDVDLMLDVPQVVLPRLLDELRDRGFTFDMEATIRQWVQEHLTVLDFHGVRVDWLKPVVPCYRHVLDGARPESWFGAPLRVA